MDRLTELEMYVDKLIADRERLIEENSALREELESLRKKLENLEKEKKELEGLIEEHQRSLNRLLEKLQGILGDREMIDDEEKDQG